MDSAKFVNWLIEEKGMSVRSAKDVLSRRGRVLRMLNANEFDENTVNELQQNERFIESSMFVKSQLKRAVILCLEFENADDGACYETI